MGLEIQPLINGREYGWADIAVTIGGIPVTGIRAVKYEEEQEKDNVYGAGRTPVSRSYGRIKCSGSISLLSGTVLALKAAAPNGQLHRMPPFSVTVTYQPDSGPITVHVLKNCEFKKDSMDWKEGDAFKEVQLDLLVSHIVSKQ